jgi:hypothetical protein
MHGRRACRMPGGRETHPPEIARQNHRQLGRTKIGACRVAARNPGFPRIARVRFAPKLNQDHERMGMPGNGLREPVASLHPAATHDAGIQKISRGFQVGRPQCRIVWNRRPTRCHRTGEMASEQVEVFTQNVRDRRRALRPLV